MRNPKKFAVPGMLRDDVLFNSDQLNRGLAQCGHAVAMFMDDMRKQLGEERFAKSQEALSSAADAVAVWVLKCMIDPEAEGALPKNLADLRLRFSENEDKMIASFNQLATQEQVTKDERVIGLDPQSERIYRQAFQQIGDGFEKVMMAGPAMSAGWAKH